MKFMLVYAICSVQLGMCQPDIRDPKLYNTWQECVNAGALKTVHYINSKPAEEVNRLQIGFKFSCNEVGSV